MIVVVKVSGDVMSELDVDEYQGSYCNYPGSQAPSERSKEKGLLIGISRDLSNVSMKCVVGSLSIGEELEGN